MKVVQPLFALGVLLIGCGGDQGHDEAAAQCAFPTGAFRVVQDVESMQPPGCANVVTHQEDLVVLPGSSSDGDGCSSDTTVSDHDPCEVLTMTACKDGSRQEQTISSHNSPDAFSGYIITTDPTACRTVIRVTAKRDGATLTPPGSASSPLPVPGDAGPDARVTASPAPAANHPSPVTAVTRKVGDFYKPVLLFNDNWALLRVVGPGVASPLSDRQSNPSRWARWRKNADEYEYETSSGRWESLGTASGYPPLPKGQTLDASYGATSFSSSGDSTFVSSEWFDFSFDGKFSTGAVSHSSYEHMVVPGSPHEDGKTGTYAIDGYLLTLTVNGKTEMRGLVVTKSRWEVWIDDSVYCRETGDGHLSCIEQ